MTTPSTEGGGWLSATSAHTNRAEPLRQSLVPHSAKGRDGRDDEKAPKGELRERRLSKAAWLVIPLLACGLALGGCTGRSLIAWGSGWTPTAASDGVVYVGTRQGEVLALDPNNGGSLIWRFAPKESKDNEGGDLRLRAVFGAPAIGEDFIYVPGGGDKDGKNGKLFALRKNRDSSNIIGSDEWVKGVEGGIVGGPALAPAEGLVLVGSNDGSLYAFHTIDDASREPGASVGDSDDPPKPGRTAWTFPTGGRIWSPPVVANGAVYFGSMDHHVYALSLEPGLDRASRVLWKYRTGGAVVAKPLFLDGMVIVGSFDRKLYALDSKTGEFLWSFKGDDWFWAGAATDGERIFAPSMGGTVYALKPKTGQLIWSFDPDQDSPILSIPAVVGGSVVVGTDGGRLYLLNARSTEESGEEVEFYKDLGKQVKAPLSSDGTTVFVGLEDSTVRGVDVARWDTRWEVSTKR